MKSVPVPAPGGLVPLLEPEGAAPRVSGIALLQLGFRPFYLLAALFAALAVPLWMAQFVGALPPPAAYPALLWHAHEMTFGFTLAVIVGFLLTAARAWTGLPTPTGTRLAVLCAIWIAARIANYAGPAAAAMLLDASFIVLAMIAIGATLMKARNYRNLFVLVILTAFLAANSLFHLALGGHAPWSPAAAARFFAFVVVVLTCVIGGRVIPTFTANALRGVRQWRDVRLDWASLAATVTALLAVLFEASASPTVVLCVVAAALQAVRLAGWNPWATRGNALLWILHASYAWIPVGLLLLALGVLGVVPSSAGLHALTLGAIGGLIIGMITRTALGHTGRPLRAGRIETAAYVLVQLAVVLRLVPMLESSLPYAGWTIAAASAWSLAFALYLVKYVPVLSRPRIDSREG